MIQVEFMSRISPPFDRETHSKSKFIEEKVVLVIKAPAIQVQHFIKHHTTFVECCCVLFNRV